MATLVYTNAKFEVNGVDLSDHASEVSLNYASEMQDETAMGDDTRIRKGGLKDWSVDVTFHQDFAANKVDATLFSVVGTTVCVELRPQNICSTTLNPIFSDVLFWKKWDSHLIGSRLGNKHRTTETVISPLERTGHTVNQG